MPKNTAGREHSQEQRAVVCVACGQPADEADVTRSVEGTFHTDCYEDRTIDAFAEQSKAEARARRDSTKGRKR